MFPSCAPIFCSSSADKEIRARCATYLTSISTGFTRNPGFLASFGFRNVGHWNSSPSATSFLVELTFDEGLQFGQCLRGVLALDIHGEFAAGTGCQHH